MTRRNMEVFFQRISQKHVQLNWLPLPSEAPPHKFNAIYSSPPRLEIRMPGKEGMLPRLACTLLVEGASTLMKGDILLGLACAYLCHIQTATVLVHIHQVWLDILRQVNDTHNSALANCTHWRGLQQ